MTGSQEHDDYQWLYWHDDQPLVFAMFWTQIAIAALWQELWEVGTWGHNPEWVELELERYMGTRT